MLLLVQLRKQSAAANRQVVDGGTTVAACRRPDHTSMPKFLAVQCTAVKIRSDAHHMLHAAPSNVLRDAGSTVSIWLQMMHARGGTIDICMNATSLKPFTYA